MKFVLLGANGRTGREVLGRALDVGDSVTAVVRAEDRLADVSHARLEVRVADVCEASALKEILPGHDLVISTLGPRMPTKSACVIYSRSAAAIVDAMQASDVRRLLVTSTALLFPSNKLRDRILRLVARQNARHAGLMEETIRAADLDWTIARLGFLDDKNSPDFRMAEGAFPDGGSVSRAAVARFLLAEAKQADHRRQVVGLSGA
jgi:putative NADH-flavin reductase